MDVYFEGIPTVSDKHTPM